MSKPSKIYLVVNDQYRPVAAFTNKHRAQQLSDKIAESGDAGYDGNDPIEMLVDPKIPRIIARGYRIKVSKLGGIESSEWIDPLNIAEDGGLIARKITTRFIAFTDPELGEIVAIIEVAINQRAINQRNEYPEQIASEIAKRIVNAGLWPDDRSPNDIAAQINSKCLN